RTAPPGRPWVQLNGEGWRPLVTWDLDLWMGQYGPRAVPGKYKIHLIIGNREWVNDLEVLKDPHTESTLEDIKKQVAFALELRDAINIVVLNINKVEVLRKELEDLTKTLKDPAEKQEAEKLLKLAESIAGKFYDIQLTGAREDAFRNPMRLYGRLSALASDINGSGIDFPPTSQQVEVKEILSERLQEARKELDEMIQKDIKDFNKTLNRKNRIIDLEKKADSDKNE
ncbi:MAG: glycosyl hydrolase, partial [Cyclobacteriaceae bacterium]|nr:glycosyl hydrolase [Cyclobacteriaceae bacterium]